VDFHVAEVAGSDRTGVPPSMIVPVVRATVRMRGTDAVPARCVALEGEVGTRVACAIYALRPGPCANSKPAREPVTAPGCATGWRPWLDESHGLRVALPPNYGEAGAEVRRQGSHSRRGGDAVIVRTADPRTNDGP